MRDFASCSGGTAVVRGVDLTYLQGPIWRYLVFRWKICYTASLPQWDNVLDAGMAALLSDSSPPSRGYETC
jgi:hypothetical protein